jgi:hypothetical protein
MRTSRRFQPAFDCMSSRIVPSTLSLVHAPGPLLASAAPTMDSSGDPSTEPGSSTGDPIILPAGNNSGGTGGVC